jgi:hypothetical protein
MEGTDSVVELVDDDEVVENDKLVELEEELD